MPRVTRKAVGRPRKLKSRTALDGQAITQLKNSASSGKLVAVFGTGVNMALTDGNNPALSWRGLIQDDFAYGVTKGKITPQQSDLWKHQLNSSDLDDLLGAAEFMGRKLGAPNGDLYARWLEEVFKNVKPLENEMVKAIRVLHAADVPLCTLNYDQLLEQVTGLTGINFNESLKVSAWMRRDPNSQGILHLHGIWNANLTRPARSVCAAS